VLSALFWLPPFTARRRRDEEARADPWGGGEWRTFLPLLLGV
jgi:hypothetical protein